MRTAQIAPQSSFNSAEHLQPKRSNRTTAQEKAIVETISGFACWKMTCARDRPNNSQ
jgi:hypothetical protein